MGAYPNWEPLGDAGKSFVASLSEFWGLLLRGSARAASFAGLTGQPVGPVYYEKLISFRDLSDNSKRIFYAKPSFCCL